MWSRVKRRFDDWQNCYSMYWRRKKIALYRDTSDAEILMPGLRVRRGKGNVTTW
jgi:hypothetical protein